MKMLLELDPDLIILDLALPPSFDIKEGLGFFQKILEARRNTKVIIMTGQGTLNEAIQCIRQGADDFLFKPVDPDVLSIVIERAIYKRFLEKRVRDLESEFDTHGPFPELIGESPSMRRIFRGIRYASAMDENVLIVGETGTGKRLVAQAIHNSSSRCGYPFVTVNCAALSPGIVESELFGHEKGSFTGATDKKVGKFEYANNGTIFLDEVAEIPVGIQAKLLTVVEEKEIQRVGGNRSIRINTRIISATNRDPQQAIKEGRFRQDLYFRLNILPIFIPPLRERREDIPVLKKYLVRKFCEKYNRTIPPIDNEVMERLMKHEWPGNVRELENIITRALMTNKEGRLTVEDFPVLSMEQDQTDHPWEGESEPRPDTTLQEEIDREVAVEYIEAMRKAKGNKSMAARVLGIHESTLRYRLKKYEKVFRSLK